MYIYIHIYIYIYIYIWGCQKGGLVNLRFIVFLNLPSLEPCVLAWGSDLQLVYEH